VLGTGIDQVYPRSNRHLDAHLERDGCLVTQLPLGTPPLRGNFPVRNRLISGLARGVLVVEAAMESGSLVTARLAAAQSREVFAIPGSIHSPLSKGCHWLIREGAKLTESAQDVLAELGMAPPPSEPQSRAKIAARGSLLDLMGFAPISLEQLAARTGAGVAKTAEGLSRLELDGDVAILAGGLFQRTPRTGTRH
jgi:DNA processing protein